MNGLRFIPARAGNTPGTTTKSGGQSVHPRASGEHHIGPKRPNWGSGSSPRERGTPWPNAEVLAAARFIPARAGNTRQGVEGCQQASGSSPRERGTHTCRRATCRRSRFIPARAGNTSGASTRPAFTAVHPRASGEHESGLRPIDSGHGSSPRERGTHLRDRFGGRVHRFIPARAGNTQSAHRPRRPSPVHPRASGEHAARASFSGRCSGSSPRERGTPCGVVAVAEGQRFIPARAGNTVIQLETLLGSSVHPRASGEHRDQGPGKIMTNGSSPRERGTPSRQHVAQC